MSIINAWRNSLYLITFAFYCSSCGSGSEVKIPAKNDAEIGMTSYANHFSLKKHSTGYKLQVLNPWQNATDITLDYQLNRSTSNHESIDKNIINIPVQRVVCLSTTHIGFISELNLQHTVVGLSGTRFVYDSIVNARINNNKVFEVGYEENLDYELIASLQPDVVIAFSITQANSKQLESLVNLGIPVVYNAEYLENDPLGKAEWIKFFGALYDITDLAEEIFQEIVVEYNQLDKITEIIPKRPVVLTGLPYKDVWYVANSKSHLARMIHQAGGRYLWQDYTKKEVYPLDLEAVYTQAMHADVWINAGYATSVANIIDVDARIADFPVVKQKNVFNNNRRMGLHGGNDYFESGAVHPQLIVKDMIKIFHPEKLPDHQLFYYQKLD